MKKWQKGVALGSGMAVVMAALFTSSLAWFSTANKAGLDSGIGYTASSYFAGGDGSASNPYLIKQPIHLYNLAWLQYLGYFNQVKNGAYVPVYFALASDVDMTSDADNNWTLPPIGTTTYPFIGSFDGQNYIVSNLNVDNALGDGHITRKPTIVSSLTGVNIVGTFGVVGDYNGALGSATYSSAANVIKNLYLDNVNVTSQLNNTLLGVAAGYVNAAISGVGVAESHLTVNSGALPLDSSALTSNLSDYATVGYATDAYKTTRKVTATDLRSPTSSTAVFSAQQSGTENAWGGSIDMQSMFNRLTSFQNNATTLSLASAVKTATVTTDVGGNSSTSYTYYGGSFKEYYDSSNPLKGSYSFSIRSDSTTSYIYLYGHKALNETITTNTLGTYKLYSGSNYLSVSGTTLANTTSSGSAATWSFTNFSGSGNIFTLISGSRYYLNYTGSLAISKTASTSWTLSGGKLSCTYNGRTYYLYYSSGWKTTTTSGSASTMSTTVVIADSTSTSTTPNGIQTRDTYFPLNVDSNYLPTASNTGYVISGPSYENTDTSMGYPYRSGDIRVSQYAMSNISTALSGNTTYSDSKLEVLTKTSKSGGNFVRIYDDYNKNNTVSSSSDLYSYTKSSSTTTATALGLAKYAKSRASVSTLLTGQSNIYGLHFMDATINSSNLATATSVRINKANSDVTDYSNYSMPRDSIDFNLRKKGYINFFSGTYFTDNNSFFSLHQITRDSGTQAITSIKEISKIYQSSVASDPYIYQYSDGTYSGTLSSNYSTTPVFDTTWIKAPTMVNNAVYYFEIPVNDGEYALGSVSGGLGAYLLYLDISANAQVINRTAITDYAILTTNTYEYPLGVAMVVTPTSSSKETVNALLSAAVALNSGYVGELTFAKTGTTVTLTSGSNNFSPGFKGDSITLLRGGGGSLSPVPKSTATSTIKRLTYIDYNTATGETTQTIITNTDGTMTYSSVANDGTVTTPTQYFDNQGDIVTIGSGTVAIDVSNNTTSMLSYWYSYSAASSTVTVNFSFAFNPTTSTQGDGTTFTGATITSYSVVLTSGTDNLNVAVTVANGTYTLKINGTVVAVGSVVTVTP